MSLLRTRSIAEGSILAYTGVNPEEGQTFIWGNSQGFDLQRGDVVQVLEIHRRDGSPWARVLVAVLKGKSAMRVGQVMINMETRLQRAWQCLTPTGSMAAVRETGKHKKVPENGPPAPAESGFRVPDHKTTPAHHVEATFEGDSFGNVMSILPRAGNG